MRAARGGFSRSSRIVATPFLLLALLLSVALPGNNTFADPAATASSAWSLLPREPAPAGGDARQTRGKEVFDQRCAACHGEIPAEIYGPIFLPPMPGTQALQARYRDALPAPLEQRTDLVAEYVKTVVRNGFISMPFFRPTEVSDEDLDALVAWLTRRR